MLALVWYMQTQLQRPLLTQLWQTFGFAGSNLHFSNERDQMVDSCLWRLA